MKEHSCRLVSKEELAAYADGELSASEVARIADHLATCPDCRVVADSLERSLQVTQAIWQTGQAQWPKTHSIDGIVTNRHKLKKILAVAASALLVLGAGAMWRLLSERGKRTRLVSEDEVAELRLKIAESGHAAQLLAAAELLSRYPGVESGVKQRYRHIVETYPETAAAAQARLKMK